MKLRRCSHLFADLGGGPTWQHLVKLRRCHSISNKASLLLNTKFGDSEDRR